MSGPGALSAAELAWLARAGIDPAAFVAARSAAFDAGVAERLDASVATLASRLAGAGWIQLYPGADGLGAWLLRKRGLRLIHSLAREDGDIWAHVSLSRADRVMPTWEQIRDAWRLLYPETAGVVVIPAATSHVNLGEVAHVWGNLDRPAVPEFSHGLGTI